MGTKVCALDEILWPKEEKLRIDEQFWNMFVPLGRYLDPAGIIRETIG